MIEIMKQNPWAAAKLVFQVLAYTALIAFNIYCTVLITSLILGALAGTLPYGLAFFIAMLPLLLSAAVLIKEFELLYQYGKMVLQLWALSVKNSRLDALGQAGVEFTPPQRNLLNNLNEARAQQVKGFGKWAEEVGPAWFFFIFSAFFALFAALGFGIYLAVKVLPGVVAAIAAKGMSYGLAVWIGGIMAGCGLITLTFLVLTMPSLAILFVKGCTGDFSRVRQGHYRALLPLVGKLSGFAFAAYLSTIIYPLTVEALVTFAPAGLAGFTALAICVGLALFLPMLFSGVASFVVGRLPSRSQKSGEGDEESEELTPQGSNALPSTALAHGRYPKVDTGHLDFWDALPIEVDALYKKAVEVDTEESPSMFSQQS